MVAISLDHACRNVSSPDWEREPKILYGTLEIVTLNINMGILEAFRGSSSLLRDPKPKSLRGHC